MKPLDPAILDRILARYLDVRTRNVTKSTLTGSLNEVVEDEDFRMLASHRDDEVRHHTRALALAFNLLD